jgi:hypothetical protein
MKRWISLWIALAIASITFAGYKAFGQVDATSTAFQNTYVKTVDVFTNEPLDGAAAADTSDAILLTGPTVGYGYWSAWIKVDQNVGVADITFTYQLSMDGTNWAYEAGSGGVRTIAANFTDPGSETDWAVFVIEPMVAKYMRVIATAQAGNGADIDFYFFLARHPM